MNMAATWFIKCLIDLDAKCLREISLNPLFGGLSSCFERRGTLGFAVLRYCSVFCAVFR